MKENYHKTENIKEIIPSVLKSNYFRYVNSYDKSRLSMGRVDFLFLWGCSPYKKRRNQYDQLFLKRIEEISERIINIDNVSVNWNFVFCDVHAKINEIHKKHYERYFNDIACIISKNFKRINLSYSFQTLNELYTKKIFSYTPLNYESHKEFSHIFTDKDLEQIAQVRKNALSKISELSTSSNYELMILKYYYARMKIEKVLFSDLYGGSVLFNLSKRMFSFYVPQNIINLYAYSIKRGVSKPPWYFF